MASFPSLSQTAPETSSHLATGLVTAPPSIDRTKKRTKTKTPVLSKTPEEAEISFLMQELDSAKTRLTMLDSEIDDLNKTIKIQGARLKIFEENKNSNINTKYFPPNEAASRTSSCCTSRLSGSRSTCCPANSCCSPQPKPCRCTNLKNSEPDLFKLCQTVDVLKQDIEAIKTALKKETIDTISTPAGSVPSSLPRTQSKSTPVNHSLSDQNVLDTPHAQDISTSSIEEFIQEPNLNCHLPTIQLD